MRQREPGKGRGRRDKIPNKAQMIHDVFMHLNVLYSLWFRHFLPISFVDN